MKAKQATLYTLTFILALFVGVLTSCSNNDEVAEITVTRDYQTDSKVLAKFVDINKTTHEYYINSNKRNSVLSYITNVDVEELNSVNSLNLSIFKESINQVNSRCGQLAASHGVD